ncbi:MAG: hypothetical protein WBW47_05795 [Thermoplasmata archaeon]
MIVVVATFGITKGVAPVSPQPPTITINAVGTYGSSANALASPLSGVSVSVSSDGPSYAKGGEAIVIAGSGGVLDLFSGVTGTNGAVSGQLQSSFMGLASEWSALVPANAKVSLTIQATYQVQVGTKVNVYNFYNSIPYDPRTPQAPLSALLQIDLSSPTYVEPATAASIVAASTPGPECIPVGGKCVVPCPGPGSGTDVLNSSYVTGPFPLAMEYDESTSTDFMNMGLFTISQTEQFSFTGASFTQGSSYVLFGTSPSYSESGVQVNAAGGSVAATSNSATAVGILYINDVTLFVENEKPFTYTVTGFPPNCVYHYTYGPITTLIQVTGVQTTGNGIDIHSMTLPASWGQYMTQLLNLKQDFSVTEGPGSSYSVVTGLNQASGYSNQESVMNQAVNDLSLFSSVLGTALAIMDAASLAPFGSGLGVEIANSVALVASEVGLATSILQAFSSISWSMTLSTSLQALTVTNDQVGSGSGMNFVFYEAGNKQTELTTGTDPVASMPCPFVVGENS